MEIFFIAKFSALKQANSSFPFLTMFLFSSISSLSPAKLFKLVTLCDPDLAQLDLDVFIKHNEGLRCDGEDESCE